MKNLIVTVALLMGLCLGPGAQACLNDRDSDTLAHEAAGLPDVVRLISGRFERNPPLYYQMRITRVAAELKAHPERLGLYDDIAVACDRLHRDDEAIGWMEKKRQEMRRTHAFDAHEQLYRYYANNGTFWAHRWIRARADPKRIHEMQVARDMIAEAIHLKPDAHFGREKYQLAAMQWIIYRNGTRGRRNGTPNTPNNAYFVDYLNDLANKYPAKYPREGLVEGLSGLVVLGDAWESYDIFDALAWALEYEPAVSYLASLRCSQLLRTGHGPVCDDTSSTAEFQQLPDGGVETSLWPENRVAVQTVYHRLRAEAEQWQRARTAYMMARLLKGRHPDTDPTFWNDYHPSPPPSLDIPWYTAPLRGRKLASLVMSLAITGLSGVAVIWGTVLVCRASRRKFRAKRETLMGAAPPRA